MQVLLPLRSEMTPKVERRRKRRRIKRRKIRRKRIRRRRTRRKRRRRREDHQQQATQAIPVTLQVTGSLMTRESFMEAPSV